jgi:hypothetical protein
MYYSQFICPDCDILFIPIQLSFRLALRILDKNFVRHLRVA